MVGHAPKKDPPVVHPQPSVEDELLEEGLEETFPASDPPSSTQPHRPLWDQDRETD